MSTVADYVNGLPSAAARTALMRCCNSTRWADAMTAARPYADDAVLFQTAERVWKQLDRADWLEAFGHHPRIGSGGPSGVAMTTWSQREQAGALEASEATRRALAEGNDMYERRFGYVFLICATGLSADQMLAELTRRLGNEPARELTIAASEQQKITQLRLQKLIAT